MVDVMTDIEALVARWLDKRKIVYEFQSVYAGGFYELGGAVVDFRLPNRNILLRVMGEYWHRQVSQEGRDLIQKAFLEGMGWKVIDLLGSDVEDRLEETMTKALRGEEMLR